MSALAQSKTTRTRTLTAVILAAGKGKRLKSANPKVLHPICGKPALWHVLQAALAAKPSKIVVVVGHGADDVRAAVRSWDIKPTPVFVEQHRAARAPATPSRLPRRRSAAPTTCSCWAGTSIR